MADTPRTVTFEAELEEGRQTYLLMQQWIGGEGKGTGLEFDLTCGAGVGNSFMRLTVRRGGKMVSELVDITSGLTAWVTRLAEELGDG